MNIRLGLIATACACLLLGSLGCDDDEDGGTGPQDNSIPGIDPADFSAEVDHPFFPLVQGTTFVYEGDSDGGTERVEFEVTYFTRVIGGVTCVEVHDRAWLEGQLIEDTLDWFAQHTNGDVWYFGEDTKEIENGEIVGTEGSWTAGVDDALPGIVMKANPEVGETYQQEFYEGEAEDMAEVLAIDATASVAYGDFTNCLQTREWTPLQPGVAEHKFYAAGVGLVLETVVEGGEGRIELVEIREP